MHTFIKSVKIRGYRSLMTCNCDTQGTLNVIIGKNGSGKTSFLSALLLAEKAYQHLEQPYREEIGEYNSTIELTIAGPKGDLKVKFNVVYSTRNNNTDAIKHAEAYLSFPDYFRDKKYKKFIPFKANKAKIILENFNNIRRNRAIFKRMSTFREYMQIPFIDDIRKKTTIEQVSRIVEGYVTATEYISIALSRMIYFSASAFTNPISCPSSFSITGTKIKEAQKSSPNLDIFIRDLFKTYKENSAQLDLFNNACGPKGLNLISKVKFREINLPSSEIKVLIGGKAAKRKVINKIVIPYFKVGRRNYSPNQMSEGTLKTIALVYYLITSERNTLLIEEPENCVHHGLLNGILSLIRQISREKQIFLTTHSESVVTKCKPENLLVTHNLGERDGAVILPLPEHLGKDEYQGLTRYLNESGSLGDFWRESGISNA